MGLMLMSAVSAANVCVVVDYKNGDMDTECVDVPEGIDGYELMNELDLDITWSEYYLKTLLGITSDYGHGICKINGLGEDVDYAPEKEGMSCEWNKKYDKFSWNFNILGTDKWDHMMVAYDGGDSCSTHYCAKDGDVIGLAFGEWGVKPEPLGIEEIEVRVEGDSDDLSEGDTIYVKPGDSLKLEVGLKNRYDAEAYDLNLEDIEITATIRDIEDGEDLEENNNDYDDLEPGDDESQSVEFEIPIEVEDKEFNLVLDIEWKDGNNKEFKKTLKYKVEVEKEKHDVRIENVKLSDEEIVCSGSTSLSINVVNMGREKEQVVLEVNSEDLGISEKKEFELEDDPFDDDSEYSTSIRINVDSDVDEGIYPILVNAGFDRYSQDATVNLRVRDCTDDATDSGLTDDEGTDEHDHDSGLSGVTGNVAKDGGELSKWISNKGLVIGINAFVYILVAILGIVLIMRVFKG